MHAILDRLIMSGSLSVISVARSSGAGRAVARDRASPARDAREAPPRLDGESGRSARPTHRGPTGCRARVRTGDTPDARLARARRSGGPTARAVPARCAPPRPTGPDWTCLLPRVAYRAMVARLPQVVSRTTVRQDERDSSSGLDRGR